MTGKGGDYEGWILRLIDKAEDILHSYSLVSWLKFAADKIEAYSGVAITKNQVDALTEYRNRAFELPEELGFSVVTKVRYRDAKGHFATKETGRAETSTVMRGEGKKFLSSARADQLVQAEIDALGVRKKPKQDLT